MNKKEVFDKYLDLLSKGGSEVEEWILSLTDEEFDMLVSFPIIVQAKIYYKKMREENKQEKKKIIIRKMYKKNK